jgi:transcriptional regulator with XRE-family HTH domain
LKYFIGNYLKEARKKKGLNLSDVAKQLNCGTSKIFYIENGERSLSIETLEDLITLYELSEEQSLFIKQKWCLLNDNLNISTKNLPIRKIELIILFKDTVEQLSAHDSIKIYNTLKKYKKDGLKND